MTSRKTTRNKRTYRKRKTCSRRKKNTAFRHIYELLGLLLLLLAVKIWGPEALPNLPPQTEKLLYTLEELFPEDTAPVSESADSSAVSLPIDSGTLRVDFLDVGQGLSVLVEADGSYLLYDGGDRETSSFVVASLKERGVETLDYIVASHYDADHINGLVGALNICEVKELLGPDYTTDTRVYNSLVSKADGLGIGITVPEPGSCYPLGQGYFEVLAPLSDGYSDVNNYSLVIRLVYGDTSFLLTGDAEEDSEAEMLLAWPDLKSDVLCVGHHGSPSSSSQAFLERVQPDYAVISCGKDNSYGHPDPTVLERLNALQIPVWRTDESGTVTVLGDGKSLLFSAEKAE